MPDFYEWDYDAKKVTTWRRTGECNHCGACCVKGGEIVFDTYDSSMMPNVTLYESNDYSPQNGGDMTTGEGIWTQNIGEPIYFGNVRHDPTAKGTKPDPCPCFIDGKCEINETKPKLCQVFPQSPSQIKTFPDCSYVFEMIEQEDFED